MWLSYSRTKPGSVLSHLREDIDTHLPAPGYVIFGEEKHCTALLLCVLQTFVFKQGSEKYGWKTGLDTAFLSTA